MVAVKRWAAHLGAWPWEPDKWDDSYSNRIAHGDSPPGSHAGVAGIQRWAKISPASGWFGEGTFNFARSVVIPQGRTHAGEPAWDATCQALCEQAYDLAHPERAKGSVRLAALARADGEVGTIERSGNLTEYGDWYGENGVPWCAIFCTWAYKHGASDVGATCPSFQTVREVGSQNDRHDYVPYIVSDARGSRYGFSVTTSPLPGDLVCFDWNWNGEHDHVGLFDHWDDDSAERGIFWTVEGNTSPSDNSNGGQVMSRSRNQNAQGTVFVRVAEAA